ncbi:hypothetical protein MUNTM_35030 [Mycobacterium sp. MUNTM1]
MIGPHAEHAPIGRQTDQNAVLTQFPDVGDSAEVQPHSNVIDQIVGVNNWFSVHPATSGPLLNTASRDGGNPELKSAEVIARPFSCSPKV